MLRDGFEGALYSNSAAVTRPLSYCGRCVTPDKEHASCSPVDGCGGSVNNGDASTGFAVQSRAFVPADKMIVAPHAWPRASSAACGAEDGAVSEVTERSALAPNLSMTERNDADGEVAANFHVRGPTSLACLADRKDECGAGLGAGAIPVIPSTTAAVTTEDGARYPHCPIFIPSKGRSDFERGTVTLLVRELIPFTVVVEAPEAEGYIQFIDQLVVRFYGISGMTYGGTAIDDDDDAITETEDYAVEGAIGPEGERRKASQDGARGGEKREAAEPVGGACAAKAYAHTGRSPHSDDVLSASASTSECGARNGRSSTSLCGGGPVGQTARAHVAGEAPHGVRVEPAADGSGAKHLHPHARVDLSLADTETAAMTDANPYLANIRALYHHGYVFHPHRAGPHSSRRLASCARPPRRRDHGGVEEGHVCEADSLSLGTEDVENGRRHGTRCHACTGTGSQVAGAHAISTSAMIHTSPSATAGDAAAHGLHEEEEEQEDTEEMDVRVLHTAAAVRDLFCVEVLPESGMGVSYVRNYILQVLVPGMMIEHCIDVDGHVDEVGLFSPGEHATLHENALRSLQLDPAVYRALEQSHAATRVASAQPPHIFYGFYWVLDDDIGAFYRSDASGKRNCRVSTRAMLREVGTRLSEMRRRALAAGKRSYHASSCASGHGRGGSMRPGTYGGGGGGGGAVGCASMSVGHPWSGPGGTHNRAAVGGGDGAVFTCCEDALRNNVTVRPGMPSYPALVTHAPSTRWNYGTHGGYAHSSASGMISKHHTNSTNANTNGATMNSYLNHHNNHNNTISNGTNKDSVCQGRGHGARSGVEGPENSNGRVHSLPATHTSHAQLGNNTHGHAVLQPGHAPSRSINLDSFTEYHTTACYSLEYSRFAFAYGDKALAINSYNTIACLFNYALLHTPPRVRYFPTGVTLGVRSAKEVLGGYGVDGQSYMMWYRFAVREDYDFTLQLIARGLHTVRFRNLSFDVPQMNKVRGGMTDYYRTAGDHMRAENQRFVKQWPSVAQHWVKGKNDTERDDIRVRWDLLHPIRTRYPGAYLYLRQSLCPPPVTPRPAQQGALDDVAAMQEKSRSDRALVPVSASSPNHETHRITKSATGATTNANGSNNVSTCNDDDNSKSMYPSNTSLHTHSNTGSSCEGTKSGHPCPRREDDVTFTRSTSSLSDFFTSAGLAMAAPPASVADQALLGAVLPQVVAQTPKTATAADLPRGRSGSAMSSAPNGSHSRADAAHMAPSPEHGNKAIDDSSDDSNVRRAHPRVDYCGQTPPPQQRQHPRGHNNEESKDNNTSSYTSGSSRGNNSSSSSSSATGNMRKSWKGYIVERWRDIHPSEASRLGLQPIPPHAMHVGQTVAIVLPLFTQRPSVVRATLIEQVRAGGVSGTSTKSGKEEADAIQWTAVAQDVRGIPLLSVTNCYVVPPQGTEWISQRVDQFFDSMNEQTSEERRK